MSECFYFGSFFPIKKEILKVIQVLLEFTRVLILITSSFLDYNLIYVRKVEKIVGFIFLFAQWKPIISGTVV